jgi:hypothetical protein
LLEIRIGIWYSKSGSESDMLFLKERKAMERMKRKKEKSAVSWSAILFFRRGKPWRG